ncbi:MAG: FtsX-like permease family protein, partial [Alicyclobacillus sp.]|nr:FtsX-like permease family protein [Alicyclobacillus sp.]
IAAISLIVGGIGIMNIMLVSVTERTREIGIRKAVGAKKRNILLQFLVESVVLSVSGGLIGVLLGGGGSYLVGQLLHMGNLVAVKSILYSVGFALMVGIVFGVYPARKASNLNPIEALRYE